MKRNLVPLVAMAVALCAFAGLAHADLCIPINPNADQCNVAVTSTIVNGQGEFSLAQINPAFGQPISGSIFLALTTTLSGTDTVTYTCPPFQNGREPPCNFGPDEFMPVLSSLPGSPIPFSIVGDLSGGGFSDCSGNPNGQTCTQGFPWMDGLYDVQFLQEYNPANPGYDPTLAAALTGTGKLTFGIVESRQIVFATNDVQVSTLNRSPFTVELQYFRANVVVPEPSLGVLTAAGLLGIVLLRWGRRRSA
jgi:hypothetical protein